MIADRDDVQDEAVVKGFLYGFVFGMIAMIIGLLLIVKFFQHQYKDKMYASSPKEVIENWTYPAFIAGYTASHTSDSDAGERYHEWFEAEYEKASRRIHDRQ
jgi:hypothetical protein